MPLTLYQFNVLNDNYKAEVVWNTGVFIGERVEDIYKILLYQLPNFYVEMWYEPEANEIYKIGTFVSIDKLSPYLSNINIHALLNE